MVSPPEWHVRQIRKQEARIRTKATNAEVKKERLNILQDRISKGKKKVAK